MANGISPDQHTELPLLPFTTSAASTIFSTPSTNCSHKLPPRPHILPPPPPPHVLPPHPHVLPPPSPDSHTAVIIVVFASFGGLLFVAFLLARLCCLIKKKKKKAVQEIDNVNVDNHLKFKEDIVKGPHGEETVVLTIEKDIRIQEKIMKNENLEQHHHHVLLHKNTKAAEHGRSSEMDISSSSRHPSLTVPPV